MRNTTPALAPTLCNRMLLLIAVALWLTSAQTARAQTTYAVSGNTSQLCGTVDLSDGHWTLLASGQGHLVGLGTFAGNLYGGGGGLLEVNPANCHTFFIGGNLNYEAFGSTTGASPALYGISDGGLYLVHANDGSAMFIGQIDLTTYTSMSSNCPVLYTTATLPNGNSALYSVNTDTGATTEIGDTGVTNLTALLCSGNTLYATKYNSYLCTLNVNNGVATCQIITQPDLIGLATPSPPPTFTVLHSFTGGADGRQPWAGMITDSAGNLYGTSGAGGTGSCMYLGATGCGVIFELKKHNSSFTFNPLYSFQGGTNGEFPARPLTLGPNGTYYGTTTGGGEGTCSFLTVSGCGTVFNAGPEAQPPRQPLIHFLENVLYRFTGGSDGGSPFSTVVFDHAGNIYGTTVSGGANGLGTVFELSPAGGGTYTETVLYNFAGGSDGANPYDGVVFDSAGNLYGTTVYGGGSTGCQPEPGCGTVFKLSPSGGSWTETVIYRFQGTGDGEYPTASVAIDAAGNLYGNTNAAQTGQGGYGASIYKLTPNGSNWTFSVFYPIAGGFGYGRVVLDASGNLYEAIQGGGAFGYGQVFQVAHDTGIYTDLYDFTNGADGKQPYGTVTVDSSGNVYGTNYTGGGGTCNCGIVWQISPGS